MAKILYLAHRIPYPPDKGDKITTFNFLRHLSQRHQVYLGAFVDSPEDWAHEEKLRSYCTELKLVGIAPLRRRLWSARALLGARSLTEAYYASAALQTWVDATMRERGIDAVLAYCSAMAPYVADARYGGVSRVTHYADVDSEKWNSYAESHRGLMSWVYRREARTLLALERSMSQAYDVTSFISDADADLYRRLAPESAARVRVIPNGVDTDYYDPDLAHEPPYAAGAETVVFVGAMDYWPNVDAVRWFADEVLPLLRHERPAAEFWIVGSKPTNEVKQLAERPGVHVTGRVPDVRPYVAHAGAVVAPLRVARGTQNKVLEAYAMARRVALTSAAANGLRPDPFIAADTHDEPAALAGAVARALAAPPRHAAARDYVMRNFSWASACAELDRALRLD
ncbi:MAG: TIGR03087 family PEP-CTERM/XrtA system glycosyltransferase [Burkholderiales bacterium]|nr:TIGR03087 family PEP-CTERM/XrtA system glycosyltransferase [Burkholderiales bacterium]